MSIAKISGKDSEFGDTIQIFSEIFAEIHKDLAL